MRHGPTVVSIMSFPMKERDISTGSYSKNKAKHGAGLGIERSNELPTLVGPGTQVKWSGAGLVVGVCYPLPEGEEMHDQVSTGSVVVVVAALLEVVNKSSGSIKK